MAAVKLFVLGAPWFEREDRRIHFARRRTLALGIYLAVTAQPHNRDALATLFWPEADAISGRANLRRTLYDLYRTLGNEFVFTEDDLVYSAQSDYLWIDLAEFRECVMNCLQHIHDEDRPNSASLALLAQAVDLFRGGFLVGFSLPDSPGFDSWQRLQEEQIRAEIDLALDQLIRTHFEQANYAQAIIYAERRIALDPLDEPAHRQLMQLFARIDHRAAVQRQFELCTQLLAQELGIAPTRKTLEVYQAALAGRLPSSD